MKAINRLLRWTGFALVPRHSVKMLLEQANCVEHLHPSRTAAAAWLRRVARIMPLTETDRNSSTVRQFRDGAS